jgi:predicted nucleotidyltransferase
MRISSHQKLIILHAVHEQDPQAKVILFGSRTKDDQRGDDIDLLVISDPLDFRKQ